MMALEHSKEYLMSSVARKVDDTSVSDIRSSLTKAQSTNAAIQRLRSRVLAEVDVSQVITSYDRMHHRHSRG